jgi:hypothetical protein
MFVRLERVTAAALLSITQVSNARRFNLRTGVTDAAIRHRLLSYREDI